MPEKGIARAPRTQASHAPHTAWEDLANAIVIRAATDYRNARKYKNDPKRQNRARARIRETERFFRSRWYAQLTDVDGEFLLGRLQEECHES